MPQMDRDSTDETQEEQFEELSPAPEGWQREIRCPITGRWVVARRPGVRKLLEDFP
jgi:hypothetical protein